MGNAVIDTDECYILRINYADFLAGLQNVPEMLYEAAKVDGANTIHMFFKITLPLVSPVIFYNLIMSMISALQILLSPWS